MCVFYANKMECIELEVDQSPKVMVNEQEPFIDNSVDVVVIEEIEESVETEPKPYSEEDYELLAHLIMGEAGADWCKDEMLFLVGCVALNRVKSDKFPDTLEEVIYQKGQYQCVVDGNFDKEPTDRCWEIALELLIDGSYIPENVVFQAEFEQGSGVYTQVQNMYFCYE